MSFRFHIQICAQIQGLMGHKWKMGHKLAAAGHIHNESQRFLYILSTFHSHVCDYSKEVGARSKTQEEVEERMKIMLRSRDFSFNN